MRAAQDNQLLSSGCKDLFLKNIIMNKEEIEEFLKENLKINLFIDRDKDLNVTVLLCDKEICTDWVVLPELELHDLKVIREG